MLRVTGRTSATMYTHRAGAGRAWVWEAALNSAAHVGPQCRGRCAVRRPHALTASLACINANPSWTKTY